MNDQRFAGDTLRIVEARKRLVIGVMDCKLKNVQTHALHSPVLWWWWETPSTYCVSEEIVIVVWMFVSCREMEKEF